MRPSRQSRPARQRGFTYLAVMFMVFLLLLAASAASLMWRIEAQREAETELLFRGQQFAAALDRYKDRRKGLTQPYPTKLEQLLRDANGVSVQRDLRQMYLDPMTNSPNWGIVRSKDGGIIGVFSPSTRTSIKRAGFPLNLDGFATTPSYSSWIFYARSASEMTRGAQLNLASDAVPVANPPPTFATPSPSATGQGGSPDNPDVGSAPPVVIHPAVGKNPGCGLAIASDAAICAQQFSRFGTQAGEDCASSQAARAQACSAGEPLPILYFRSV